MLEVELAVTGYSCKVNSPWWVQQNYGGRGESFHIELLQSNELIPCWLYTTLHQWISTHAKGYLFLLLSISLDPIITAEGPALNLGRGEGGGSRRDRKKGRTEIHTSYQKLLHQCSNIVEYNLLYFILMGLPPSSQLPAYALLSSLSQIFCIWMQVKVFGMEVFSYIPYLSSQM